MRVNLVPRFVILRHDPQQGDARPLHWDLMLEQADGLRTWALAQQPSVGSTVSAELLADHRKMYLDYEGLVPGDRGTVTQWDWGEFDWVAQSTDRILVRLIGQRLNCTMWLEPCQPDAAAPGQRWSVSFLSDFSGAC